MKQAGRVLLLYFVLLFAVSAAAQDKVVVIPLSSAKKLKNVVTVSAKGGDFTDPVAAVNSISGADGDNPWLVVIGPGVYTLSTPLIMKEHVAIAGAGKDSTTLKGAISAASPGADSALVVGATNATLSDLSIWNSGGGSQHATGIFNANAIYDITRVKIVAGGGTAGNYGMYNSGKSRPIITDSRIHAYGNGFIYGVYNDDSSPTLDHSDVSAVVGEGLSGNAFGFSSRNASTPSIRYSTLYGDDYGLQQAGGTVHVSHSSITSLYAVDSGGGAVLVCVYNDDGRGGLLGSTCHNDF